MARIWAFWPAKLGKSSRSGTEASSALVRIPGRASPMKP